ncbi:MAG: arsenite methyltransferase [Candidatus Delongbacteria bacterium]|jgi:arsenite methyltransferase|nr:arsenite methyltransferase [Candidatus Delongbacteria bacterium]
MNDKEKKAAVKEKYSGIARQSLPMDNSSCCDTPGCCGEGGNISMSATDYHEENGYNADADLGLGCGVPTRAANIKAGDRVLDLGSGAGSDCFVVRSITGSSGHVTGIDFSEEMVEKARHNVRKAGFDNMNFMLGDIDNMPFKDNQFDVVISNCVLNLVPDKEKAISEIMRVLKPGGHFCISDVLSKAELPESLRSDAELYASCVSGAPVVSDYLSTIDQAGFEQTEIHKKTPISIPENILKKHLDDEQLQAFRSGKNGVFSVTISGTKPTV